MVAMVVVQAVSVIHVCSVSKTECRTYSGDADVRLYYYRSQIGISAGTPRRDEQRYSPSTSIKPPVGCVWTYLADAPYPDVKYRGEFPLAPAVEPCSAEGALLVRCHREVVAFRHARPGRLEPG
jgi:hypothetical protein